MKVPVKANTFKTNSCSANPELISNSIESKFIMRHLPFNGKSYLSLRSVRHSGAMLVLAGFLAACGGKKEDAVKDEATQITIGRQDMEPARSMDVVSGIVLSGPLDPAQVVRVKAQVPGTVRDVRVDRGSAVRAGQVLATIEALGVQSQAASAKAGVAAREAGLAVAKQQLDASKTLFEAGAISEIDFRGAQAAYEAAEAELAAAKANAAAAGESASRSILTSPITGFISERFIEGGEAIMPDAPLFTVVNADTLELAGQIPVDQAGSVKVGQPVVFTLDALPGKEFNGRVARIDPTADLQTRQVRVYVRLLNRNKEIIAGQFARGRIVGQRVSNVITVPEIAIRRDGDQPTVFVIENGVVAVKEVTLGLRDEATGRIAVMSGLSEGDQVITAPALTLTPGTKVNMASSLSDASDQSEVTDSSADSQEPSI